MYDHSLLQQTVLLGRHDEVVRVVLIVDDILQVNPWVIQSAWRDRQRKRETERERKGGDMTERGKGRTERYQEKGREGRRERDIC